LLPQRRRAALCSAKSFEESSLVSEEQAPAIKAAPAKIDAAVSGENDRFMDPPWNETPAH
jgi:hypothetical protein